MINPYQTQLDFLKRINRPEDAKIIEYLQNKYDEFENRFKDTTKFIPNWQQEGPFPLTGMTTREYQEQISKRMEKYIADSRNQ